LIVSALIKILPTIFEYYTLSLNNTILVIMLLSQCFFKTKIQLKFLFQQSRQQALLFVQFQLF